jgi:drug/metabolite transporter (DMT)-like permease
MLPSFGKALQKAASQELPMLSFSSIASYLYHKQWLLGIAGDLCGGALTLVALAHAPISIVQPVMCSGMGMSALIAVYYLHESIAPPDWFSTFLILLGRHYFSHPHQHVPP